MTMMTEDSMARILLIDDHPAVRHGLKLLLSQENYVICGEAGDRSESLKLMTAASADVVLLDLSLGEENGLDMIEALQEHNVVILVYSMHEDARTIERAFAAGAHGYVTKREESAILLCALTEVLAGRRYISPRAAQSLASKILFNDSASPENELSNRERQILYLLHTMNSSADIAAELSISHRTVESYCARIIEKLKLDGMKSLRRYAASLTLK